MKRFLLCLISLQFVLANVYLKAQETRFYMAKEFKQAYESDTRSWNGKPGPNYWQNTVDYTIEASIDLATRTIRGTEKVIYYNNSSKSLSSLVVRLYYDVYAKMKARDPDSWAPEDLTDGVEISRLVVDGTVYEVKSREVSRSGTNMIIHLNKALNPSTSISLEIDWITYIPWSSNRTGRVDSTSYFVAYWYPQISVFDDIFGWDQLNYGGRTEFYNNLANFDVTINVPETITVWATGELQNGKDVLDKKIYKRFLEAKKSSRVINVITPHDIEEGINHSGKGWHFKAQEVSDFAFGISDHYGWDAAIQPVDGRDVLINSVFPSDRAVDCAKLTAIQQKTMKHFSEDIPGVPYPYPVFTTFIGSERGGMEYPMMANNGYPGRGVTIHEMFHTYFPMYVRTNEKRFAWMDEGWANLITRTVTNTYFRNQPDTGIVYDAGLSNMAGRYHDLPLITSSQYTDGSNYNSMAYGIPAFVYGMLHHILGPDVFHGCLKEYIIRWAKKSPTPYDFFYTFENVSGRDLGWFWSPWFFEFSQPDLRLKSFSDGILTVEKIGNKPVPLRIRVVYSDSQNTNIITKSASIWEKSNTFSMKLEKPGEIDGIFINIRLPDAYRYDNLYPEIESYYDTLEVIKEFEGIFRLTDYFAEFKFEYSNKILFINSPWTGRTALIPKSQHKYITPEEGHLAIEFLMDNGKCSGANISVWGEKSKAIKL
ncbi:M1 family metallopeptidase [Bacteroidota bacterium]